MWPQARTVALTQAEQSLGLMILTASVWESGNLLANQSRSSSVTVLWFFPLVVNKLVQPLMCTDENPWPVEPSMVLKDCQFADTCSFLSPQNKGIISWPKVCQLVHLPENESLAIKQMRSALSTCLGREGKIKAGKTCLTAGLDTLFKAANGRQTPPSSLLLSLVLTEPWTVWDFFVCLFRFVFLYFFFKQTPCSATRMAAGIQGRKYPKVAFSPSACKHF